MANVNQLANIISGDTKGLAMNKQRRAQASLGQYRHQKEIIENINKAIEDAQKRTKKNKFGFGVGGSLLGTLLGAAISSTGIGAFLGPSISSALGAAAGSWGAEKYRQDNIDWDKSLDDAKAKYKGRKQENLLDNAKNQMDSMLRDQMRSGMMMDALTGFFMPVGKDASGVSEAMKKSAGGGDNIIQQLAKGKEALKGSWLGTPGMQAPDFLTDLVNKNLKSTDVSWLSKLGQGQYLTPSTRALLPSLAQSGFKVKDTSPIPEHVRYSAPQFRNPYGGMGGY